MNTQTPPDWMSLLTPQAAHAEKSMIREIFKLLTKSDIISFAGGLPDSRLFPYAKVKEVFENITSNQDDLTAAISYGPTEGYAPLREWIVSHMATLGAQLEVDNILITSGAQQALDVTCRAMLCPGDGVVVGAPTYLGALQILKSYQANIIAVSFDDQGPVLSEFEAALDQNVKFVYLVSDFSNPTGLSISLQRRKALVEIARHHGVPIIDDAAYQQLGFYGEPIDPLITLDQSYYKDELASDVDNGGVIHLGTFSKTMMPGLRVGWMAAPKSFIDSAVTLKQATDLHSSILTQMATHKIIDQIYDDHVVTLRDAYRVKRDCMVNALEQSFPDDVGFSRPNGGMFVWVTLPNGINAIQLLDKAMNQAKVAYIPGASFFASADGAEHYCRLSYSGPNQAQIEDGIERLGSLIKTLI